MASAQDSLATHIDYDLTAEAAVGSGDFTAYQLATNRHHVLGTRANTAYLRAALSVAHQWTPNLTVTAVVDGVAGVHADHKAYLQQCFTNLAYRQFFIEAGSRELKHTLRDEDLSTGGFVNGINAKPVPQLHFGTSDFWDLPLTKGWLQAHFDFGYGKFMDSGYREEMFEKGGSVNPTYSTGAFFHQKHLYFRTNPTKRLFVTAGIEHAVQFGGTSYSYVKGVLTANKKPTNLRTFTNIILPLGDSHYYENGVMEDWIYGNHIGTMTVQVGWNIDEHHQVEVYLDDLFEDGSGMRRSNGCDGLWGLQYRNKAPGRQYVRGAVLEYFTSTNQSGPIHWDGGDFPEPVRSQITDLVTGNDNYYNHMFYVSYTHYGMTPGNALITSPIYNKDGFTGFRDNRVKAWHVAVNGEITPRLSYLLKGSYREGWGTYSLPLAEKHHSFDAMAQATYHVGRWQLSGAYALDKGNIYGDCSTLNFRISYHGKIL